MTMALNIRGRRRVPGLSVGRIAMVSGEKLSGAIATGKAILADPMVTVEEVTQQLGTAPLTLYRYIPGGRGAVLSEAA
jgi:hypothetical protein